MGYQDIHDGGLLVVSVHAAVHVLMNHIFHIEIAIFLVHSGNHLGMVHHF